MDSFPSLIKSYVNVILPLVGAELNTYFMSKICDDALDPSIIGQYFISIPYN